MKVDFNHEIGPDPLGHELLGYYEAWYRLWDQLRDRYPHVFFEGCSGGGMRLDANVLKHFDGHFLTDTINPVDVLRITQGTLLRLPPGRITKWLRLRCVGKTIAQYGKSITDVSDELAVPCGATWERSETVNVDFPARATFQVSWD